MTVRHVFEVFGNLPHNPGVLGFALVLFMYNFSSPIFGYQIQFFYFPCIGPIFLYETEMTVAEFSLYVANKCQAIDTDMSIKSAYRVLMVYKSHESYGFPLALVYSCFAGLELSYKEESSVFSFDR